MLRDIVSVKPLSGYRLWIRFEDDSQGEIDLSQIIRFEGVFAPLQQHDFFEQVAVDPEIGTIFWPNGADLDPDVLYARVTGQPIPAFTDHSI